MSHFQKLLLFLLNFWGGGGGINERIHCKKKETTSRKCFESNSSQQIWQELFVISLIVRLGSHFGLLNRYSQFVKQWCHLWGLYGVASFWTFVDLLCCFDLWCFWERGNLEIVRRPAQICLLYLSSHHLSLTYFDVCPIFVRSWLNSTRGWLVGHFFYVQRGRYLPEVLLGWLTMT